MNSLGKFLIHFNGDHKDVALKFYVSFRIRFHYLFRKIKFSSFRERDIIFFFFFWQTLANKNCMRTRDFTDSINFFLGPLIRLIKLQMF